MTTRSTRRLIFGGVTVSVALMTLVSQILLAPSNLDQRRIVTVPGAGGFAGGAGGSRGTTGLAAEAGQGPGGGAPSLPNVPDAKGGTFSGNRFLVPLIGGSGGGGNLNFCGV